MTSKRVNHVCLGGEGTVVCWNVRATHTATQHHILEKCNPQLEGSLI